MTTPCKDLHGSPGRYCAETSGFAVMARCSQVNRLMLMCNKYGQPLLRPSAINAINAISGTLKCEQCLAAQKGRAA